MPQSTRERGVRMFQKKDIIFSESIGVCRVDDVTKITMRVGESPMYYVLRSHYDKSKVCYIPVENHQVTLRELRSREELENLLKDTEAKMLPVTEQGEAAYVLGITIDELLGVVEDE